MSTNTQAIPGNPPVFRLSGVLIIAAGHLLHDTYSAFLFPLLPLLIDKMSLSLTMAGTLTLFLRLPSLIQPVIGHVADRVNLRVFTILAPLLTSIMMSLLGLAPNLGILIVMVTVVGLSSAAFHAPAPAAVSRFSASRLGLGLSIYQMAGELGRTLGPMLVVAAVSLWSLEGIYRLMIIGLLASALLYWKLRDAPFERHPHSDLNIAQIMRQMRPILLPLTWLVISRSLMSTSLVTYLPVYLDQQGASLWLVGGAITILEGAGVVGVLAAGALSDLWGRRTLILMAQILAPALLLLFLVVDGWLIFPVLIALGFAVFSSTPVLFAVVLEHQSENRATASGIYSAISFALGAVATLLVGYVGDHLGLKMAFTISAMVVFAGIPFVFMLLKK
jgi:MFS transporter, FSR family, fosmidomycin resistance protein